VTPSSMQVGFLMRSRVLQWCFQAELEGCCAKVERSGSGVTGQRRRDKV
jgi:hypothetical protein